jgi:uncharacterized protein YvpB
MKLIFRNIVFVALSISLSGCGGGFGLEDAFELAEMFREEFENSSFIELMPAQIQEKRNTISEIEDEEEKRQAYKKLQYQTPYQNQRANKEKGDISCNVTALSSALSFLGKNVSPDQLSKEIYELCNDKSDKGKQFCRETAEIRARVAKEYHGAKRDKYNCANNSNLGSIANKTDEFLGNGKAVMISSQGHIVQVVDIIRDREGNPTHFVVNDPYGKQNLTERAKNGGRGGYGVNANEKFNPKNNKGKHNQWDIAEMERNNIRIKYCEVYEENIEV